MIMQSFKQCFLPLVPLGALATQISPAQAQTQPSKAAATITVQAGGPGKKISPDLLGIFFEDINYAADGGLYAELVQNHSFEYSPADRREWNSLTNRELVERGGGKR